MLRGKDSRGDIPEQRRLARIVTLSQVEESVCREYGVPRSSLRRGRIHGNVARKAMVYLARKVACAPVKEICASYGMKWPSVLSNIVRRLEADRRRDRELDRRLRRIERTLIEK